MTPAHHAIIMLLLFAVGLCVGSFLNVCIYRIPAGLCVIRPRSRCPRCSSPIRPTDNIPVVSWLILRGECRECHGEISPRYTIVELTIGFAFALVYVTLVTLSPIDLWDRTGPLGVVAAVVLCCLPLGLLLAILLMRHDRRMNARPLAIGHRVRGQE